MDCCPSGFVCEEFGDADGVFACVPKLTALCTPCDDDAACEAQFRNAFLQGCVGAWTLHPKQIDIAKRVFVPDVEEAKFALRILEAMPDGTGAVMIDGKMQDDATWKQAKVMVDLAKLVATKDPELAEAYGL